MANIEIETSTDTVEEVKEALGATVEIEESEEVETPAPKKPAKVDPPAESEEEEPAAEVDTEEESEEEEETPAPKKQVPQTVPRARLNEEIRKRKALEAQLAAKGEPKDETPAAEETRPETFSGKPEPQEAEFMVGVDQYDPAAVNKALGEHRKALRAWDREEARAEAAYEKQLEDQKRIQDERTENFRKTLPATIERLPDYQDVVGAATDVMLSGVMEDFVFASTIGGDLLYHLAQNPDEVSRIASIRTMRGQNAEMEKLETELLAAIGEPEEEEETPKAKTPPPLKKTISRTPPPPSRIKPAGPGPKSLQELAGPADRTGIDVEFNPEFERADKARRKT